MLETKYKFFPYYYDVIIEIIILFITYILFVSSKSTSDILLNCVALTFISEMDEFLGHWINNYLTISLIREDVFSKINLKKTAIELNKTASEFNEFEEICV